MRRINVKKIAMFVMALLPTVEMALNAQNKVEADVTLDLATSYIWRGQKLGGACLQPGMSVSWRGFTLGAWGSTGFNSDDTREVDLNLSYGYKGFEIGLTDYWFSDGPGYFQYAAHHTAHVFEVGLGYDFGFGKLSWYTNIMGNDGKNHNGARAYSSYVEASVPFVIAGIDWSVECGACPWQTDFYNANGFAVINIGLGASKTIRVTDSFSFPIGVKAIWNPRDDKAYLVGSISF